MRKILLIIVCIVISNYSFGQRDTLIIHEKDSFKILENQFFDKNNELVKQVFSMEGKLLPSYFTKEDLFERGIKQTSKVTIYGIVLDSIKLYKDNQIIEKQYFQNNEKHNVILRQHLYQYDDNGILENIKVIKKELMFFSRTVFKRTETIRLSNKKIDEYRVVSTKKFYPYGYDTVIVNKDDASKREYHAYFPNGTIRQKRYETDRKLDSTVTFRHDGTLMEKGFPYDDLDKRYIDGRIVHRYKPYENQPYEIDTINKFFNYLLPSSSIASESEKIEKQENSTFVANNKLSSQLKMSTVDTAFAIGLRDSLFIYQRGDSKILEGRFYYKNGNIKKRVFEREKDFSTRYIDRSEYYEDLFQRNIKTSDSITYYARKLDEVILYHNDGRINEKWVDSERERFIYDENNELIGIQEIYRGQYKYAYKNKATTYFEPNQLLTLGGKYNFTYLNGITIKTRINEDLTIPFELVSHTEELVEFELISKNNIAYKSDKKVVNYGDTIIFNLNYNPTKSINNYQFTLQGKTADTTFNRNIDVNIEGYHLTQADFDKNIRYELSTNNLVLYFEKGGGKLLRVYKNDVLKAEGSVSQIMNEISFKGYARGEYMLELIDLSTRQKDKMTLILK